MNSILCGIVGRTALTLNLGAIMGTAAYFGKKCIDDLSAPAPGIGSQVLGGMTELVNRAVGQKSGLILAGTTVAAGVAALYYGHRKIRVTVNDRVMQLKESIGIRKAEIISKKVADITPESVRANSVEMSQKIPKVQIKVGKIVGGNLELYGSAIRILDSLVMPAHVLVDATDSDGNVIVKGSQGSLRLDAEDFKMLDTDLVMKQLSAVEFSRIGMPIVSLSECLPMNGDYTSIVGVQGKGSVGVLKHDPTSFGKVVYDGTTMPGYSGAPYMKGNQVVGIHCWGGRVNGGYSASYIKVLIQKENKQRGEASEDWLMKVFKSKKLDRHSIVFNAGNDEALIRYNGQYHYIEGDIFRRAKGLDYLDGTYDDADSEMVSESLRHSGEYKSLMQPGASGKLDEPGQLELLITKVLTQQLSKLTNKQLKQARNAEQSSSSQGIINGHPSGQKPK